jgi:hypothetical protein
MSEGSIIDYISSTNPRSFFQILFDNGYYEYLFPFLLSFVLLYTILPYSKIFQNRKTKEPIKSVIFIVSLVISLFAVFFEISEGITLGKFMMMLLPNISSLTIGLLALYTITAISGYDLFKGLFQKNYSSFLFIFIGIIGFGSVLYYLGIAVGLFEFNYSGENTQWGFILAVGFTIMGIVFLFTGLAPFGLVFLYVILSYLLAEPREVFINYILDPVTFIFTIIAVLLTWMTTRSPKEDLAFKIREGEKALAEYDKLPNGRPKDYENKIFDIIDSAYQSNVEKWKKRYGDEKW